MLNLKDAVISKPVFIKLADSELSKDVSDWNEDILKNFYEQVDFLPKEIGVNVLVKNVDENKGAAKGSVVVFFNGKQINFPIVIKDNKLSPFDVFVKKEGAEDVYRPASETEVKRALISDQIATLENRWDQAKGKQLMKTPGGIMPKQSINLYEASEESIYPPFAKMSNWTGLAKDSDLMQFDKNMVKMPDVAAAFHDNTGDLMTNLVQQKKYQRETVIPNEQRRGRIDLNGVIDAKRALVSIDADMLDTSKLIPLPAPCVAEARLYEYPSMEDFLESGVGAQERFKATRIGKPVTGVVLDMIDKGSDGLCCPTSIGDKDDPKAVRERRPQVFISVDGKCFSEFDDYSKTGVGFYGTKILEMPDAVEKAVKMLSISTTDDFINTNRENKNDGADKSFAGFANMHQGKDEHGSSKYLENSNGRFCGRLSGEGMFVVYGAGTAYECAKYNGSFKKYIVNNTHVYTSKRIVLIPANVASIQKVASVNDPVYKMIVGKAENIYLIPERSLIINRGFMKQLNAEDFMRPSLPVQKVFEDSNMPKIAMCVMSTGHDIGYKIDGKPFDSMKKLANIGNGPLTTLETKTVLRVMGMDKTASDRAMTMALKKYADYNEKNKSVVVYGVNSDYINQDAFAGQEKTARVNGIWKEIAYGLRRDLIKEASVLTDPNTVDVILSLNFINEESLGNYVENIDKMEEVLSNLAQLLVAARMGLSEIDETACKNAITGLSEVVEGLKNIKMSIKK